MMEKVNFIKMEQTILKDANVFLLHILFGSDSFFSSNLIKAQTPDTGKIH